MACARYASTHTAAQRRAAAGKKISHYSDNVCLGKHPPGGAP
jgi:hypothetical protein